MWNKRPLGGRRVVTQVLTSHDLLAKREGRDINALLHVAIDRQALEPAGDVDGDATEDRAANHYLAQVAFDAEVGCEIAADLQPLQIAVDKQCIAQRSKVASRFNGANVAVDIKVAGDEGAVDGQVLEHRATGEALNGEVAIHVPANGDFA